MTEVVLLPGTLCDEAAFGAMLPRLTAPRVIDHRRFSNVHAAAASLMGDLPARCVGIAFSLGGWILLEMARLQPGRFTGLVLLSGNAHPDDPDNAARRREKVKHARSVGLSTMIAEDWPRLVAGRRADDGALREVVGNMAQRSGHVVHARQTEMNIHRPDFRRQVLSPAVPILVVAGDEDALCPSDRYEAAAAGDGSRLHRLRGVGHYVPMEAPLDTLDAIGTMFPEAVS